MYHIYTLKCCIFKFLNAFKKSNCLKFKTDSFLKMLKALEILTIKDEKQVRLLHIIVEINCKPIVRLRRVIHVFDVSSVPSKVAKFSWAKLQSHFSDFKRQIFVSF